MWLVPRTPLALVLIVSKDDLNGSGRAYNGRRRGFSQKTSNVLTSKQFSATLEVMESLNQQIPENVTALPYTTKRMLIILLLVAILSGITGYLIGVKTNRNEREYIAVQPTISPTPALVRLTLPTATLYPTTTPDPTTVKWQTYADPTYGFSFSYPPHWSAPLIGMQNGSSTYSNPDEYYVYFSTDNTISHSSNHYPTSITMEIKVDRNVNNWALNEWFYTHANGYDPQTVPQKVSSIDDYQSIQARIEPDFENDFVVAPLSKTVMINGLYEFILYGSTGEGMKSPYPDTDPFVKQELTNFHKILSSFRFPK